MSGKWIVDFGPEPPLLLQGKSADHPAPVADVEINGNAVAGVNGADGLVRVEVDANEGHFLIRISGNVRKVA